MSYKVLSTKNLTPSQKKQISNPQFSLFEKNFININPIKFSFTGSNDAVIFSSKNAVKIVLSNIKIKELLINNKIFCVGPETRKLLKKNNLNVVFSTTNGSELGDCLVQKKLNKNFIFFCGTKRSEDIENMLIANDLSIQIIEVYTTDLIPLKIDEEFDAILFFSPSAVKSFTNLNSIRNARCFCIGSSTASALMPFTKNIHVSNKPTIRNVLKNLNTHFN
tara:strand:+ start:159 stop:821 length:663 start_codon:yes stop_codon:yes gene_type:complete